VLFRSVHLILRRTWKCPTIWLGSIHLPSDASVPEMSPRHSRKDRIVRRLWDIPAWRTPPRREEWRGRPRHRPGLAWNRSRRLSDGTILRAARRSTPLPGIVPRSGRITWTAPLRDAGAMWTRIGWPARAIQRWLRPGVSSWPMSTGVVIFLQRVTTSQRHSAPRAR